MSLIHEALKEMERPSPVAAAPALRQPAATGGGARSALLAFVLVLGVGGLGLWGCLHLQSAPSPQAVVPPPAPTSPALPAQVPASAQSPAAPPPAAAAPADPVGPAAAAPTESAAAASGAAGKASPATDAPAAAVPSARNTAAVAAAPPQHRHAGAATLKPKPATKPQTEVVEEEMPPEKRFALFLQAMKSSDLPGAEAQLKHLRRQMTGNSMTLLRAEAWYALASGDEASARREYAAILERLPGDEEASINLASLELRAQHLEQARRLLHEALTQNPDSDALKAALARFRDVRN